jgi:hypothetical protein
MSRNRYRHTSEDVGRAIIVQRSHFLPAGRIPLRWAAGVMDWAHGHLGPAEMKQIKFQVDRTR